MRQEPIATPHDTRVFDDNRVLVRFYYGHPVEVYIDGFMIPDEHYKVYQDFNLYAININTNRAMVENKNKKWWQFWKKDYINYTNLIPFTTV